MTTPRQQNLSLLPIGTALGDFKITGVVGVGGFGIVYLAHEAALNRTVAIKEYLPSAIAGRTRDDSVVVQSELNCNAFAAGLKNFLQEAQLLASVSHPAMVEVYRVWEQNATAYMAMRYYDGKTLRELRQSASQFDEAHLRQLLEPVLDALAYLHAQNVIHRDVSPDNILVRSNGATILLDLGAARLVVAGMTQALTTILKPGYAPIEQYVDDGTMHQGPWTDVYGMGAVIYFLLTGTAPPQAVARMITDPLGKIVSAASMRARQSFINAMMKALAVQPEDRYPSIDAMRHGLQWHVPLRAQSRIPAFADNANATAQPTEPRRPIVTATTHRPGRPDAAAHIVPGHSHDPDATVVQRPSHDVSDPEATQIAWRPKRAAGVPTASALNLEAPTHVVSAAPGHGRRYRWVALALAAFITAGMGYFALNRSPADDKSALPVAPMIAVTAADTPVATSDPSAEVARPAAAPEGTVGEPTPASATANANAAAATQLAASGKARAKAAAKHRAAQAKIDSDRQAASARAVIETEQRALDATRAALEETSRRELAEAAARQSATDAKRKADEMTMAQARFDAAQRAALSAKAALEERARRERADVAKRLAAAKAKRDAEQMAKGQSLFEHLLDQMHKQ